EEQSRVPGSATGVEDRAGNLIGLVEERLLRSADVPRRLSGVKVLECAAIGYGPHGFSSWGCFHRYTPRRRVSSRVTSRFQVFVEPNAIAEWVHDLYAFFGFVSLLHHIQAQDISVPQGRDCQDEAAILLLHRQFPVIGACDLADIILDADAQSY